MRYVLSLLMLLQHVLYDYAPSYYICAPASHYIVCGIPLIRVFHVC